MQLEALKIPLKTTTRAHLTFTLFNVYSERICTSEVTKIEKRNRKLPMLFSDDRLHQTFDEKRLRRRTLNCGAARIIRGAGPM